VAEPLELEALPDAPLPELEQLPVFLGANRCWT
jgi:hypothetical protein